jgi:hypothetical protein
MGPGSEAGTHRKLSPSRCFPPPSPPLRGGGEKKPHSFRFNFQKAAAAPRSRRVFFARGLSSSLPSGSRGRGNAGRPMHPQPPTPNKTTTGAVSTNTPKRPGAPHAMVLQLLRALPGAPGFLATVALRIWPSPRPVGPTSPPKDLTSASGCQDHTTWLYATTRLRQRLRGGEPV